MKRGKYKENGMKKRRNNRNMNERWKNSPDFTKIKLSRDFSNNQTTKIIIKQQQEQQQQ